MKTVKFTLRGEFAHYKRLGGSSVKQTHTIPPRTSIFGLIGAILGRPRDSYYDEFGETFDMSIVPNKIRRKSIPQLEVSTAATPQIGNTGIKSPKHRKNRQRTSIEYLVNPSFDIYLRAESFPTELIERLENEQYHYSPYMGTTECLANIQYDGFVDIIEEKHSEIDSVVPENQVEKIISTGTDTLTFERIASNFEVEDYGRNATGYTTTIVNLDTEQPISITRNNDTKTFRNPQTDQRLMFF